MYLKKYYYSRNVINDPQFSLVSLSKKLVDKKFILNFNFNNLAYYEKLAKLQFYFYEPNSLGGKTYSIYKAEGNDLDNYTITTKLVSNVVSKLKEDGIKKEE